MSKYLGRYMLIAAFLVVTACSVTGPKLVPSGLVEVELSGLFIRPLDNRPVTWLTVKVTNNSDKVFFETRSKVDDISNSVNLYGRSAVSYTHLTLPTICSV